MKFVFAVLALVSFASFANASQSVTRLEGAAAEALYNALSGEPTEYPIGDRDTTVFGLMKSAGGVTCTKSIYGSNCMIVTGVPDSRD